MPGRLLLSLQSFSHDNLGELALSLEYSKRLILMINVLHNTRL